MKSPNPTLAEVLAMLFAVDNDQDLEGLIKSIPFEVATTDDERSTLANAAISAAARCWVKRSRALFIGED